MRILFHSFWPASSDWIQRALQDIQKEIHVIHAMRVENAFRRSVGVCCMFSRVLGF